MSAIFGILRFDGAAVPARDLERMSQALAAHGPDGRNVTTRGAIGLGHCLMRVNKEDYFEAQPLRDDDAELTLVADARIDNRAELATTLGIAAAQWPEMSDSAFVLAAYRKWGEDCVDHLLGDFAFAIWDARARKLVLARDHMGQRCLLFHKGADFFAFATQVKALWTLPAVPRQLSDTMIGRYLLLAPSLTSDATPFEDIRFLFGGSLVVVSADGRMRQRRYWEPHADPAYLGRSEEDYVAGYRRVLTEAVECRIRRLIAPPAICLSAGYDTAAIAGLAGPVLRAQNRKMVAVSAVMAESASGSAVDARRWVELCRRDMPHLDVHYHARGNESEFAALDKAFATTGEFAEMVHNVVDILYRQAAASGARLIMDGMGGDGTLNPRGGNALKDMLRAGAYRRFLSEALAFRRTTGRSLWTLLRGDIASALVPLQLQRIWRRLRHGRSPAWHNWPIASGFSARLIDSGAIDAAEVRAGLRSYVPMRERMQRSLRTWTAKPSANFVNQAAVLGLELTRPMLDKRVVEFAQAIPESLYVKNGYERHLARRALADIYPPEFQTRRPNQDSLIPDYGDMVRDELPALRRNIDRLAQSKTLRTYIDFGRMKEVLDRPQSGATIDRETAHALRFFYAANYIAWFRRDNA